MAARRLTADLAARTRREVTEPDNEALRHTLRLELALAGVYALMLQTADRETLFQETCRILVQQGGLTSAAVSGIDEASGLLEPLARAGAVPDDPSRHTSDPSARPARRGPAAVRPLLREAANASAISSAAGFPLHTGGNPVAILHVQVPLRLPAQALDLLEKLAANLSLALERFEVERARAQAEALLKRSASRFRDIADAAAEYLFEVDLDGRFTYVSEGIERISGYRPDEVVGLTPVDLMPPVERDRIRAWAAANITPDGVMRDFEHQLRTRSGEVVWLRASAVGLYDDDGRRIGQRGSARDITQRKLAEQRMEQSRRFLHQLVDAMPDPIAVKDTEGRYVAANDALCALYGTSRAEILDRRDEQLLPPEAARFARDTDAQALAASGPVEFETELDAGSGRRWILVRKSALDRNDGSRVVVSVLTDLTQRREMEQALRESETRFRDFAEAASEFVWETDLQGRFIYVSSRVESVWGYRESELLGRTPLELAPPGEAERVRQWLERNMQPDGSFKDLEQRIIGKHGDVRWLQINAVGLFDAAGRRIGQRGAARDITDRKQAEARISHLATRDALTNLPNRVLLNDRLQHALAAARRQEETVAVMFIDLDRFKTINDSLGHDVGDDLLCEVAQRLGRCVRDSDTLARLGGDEFVIVLDGLKDPADARVVGNSVMQSLSAPFMIRGHRLVTSASIGVSCYPDDGQDGAALMRHADIAMYHAKGIGRNALQFFSQEMNHQTLERHKLESALRGALEADELRLVFQPLVTVAGSRVVGAEALLRWRHPEMGDISPARFVPVAEETGLIGPVGDWVIQAACEHLAAWRNAPPLRLSVNLSVGQLRDSRAFLDRMRGLIATSGIDPSRLEFEITETLLASSVAEHAEVLRQLGAMGCPIAVDDFGTGYSSLSYLKRLPIDTIKIDRGFIREIVSDADDAAIVSAIVAMAKKLKLEVVAEGVETPEQLAVLRELGCDRYQGWLFSPAVPAETFAERFLERP
jgi:diguanylate cyclase (GGDEF)-like protein/PAS domain S-box-containing protein